MFDIIGLITNSPFLLLKVGVLILIGLYVVFSIIIVVQARAFQRIVYIGDSHGSLFIQLLSLIHLVGSISLFFVALAIL